MIARVVAIAALTLAVARPAVAQRETPRGLDAVGAPDAGDAAPRARAERLYAEGNELFVNRDYTEALARYRAAVELWDHPAIRFNMAECYVSLVQPLKAYLHLERALASGPEPLESEAHYRRGLELRERLRAQLGVVVLRSEHVGAQLSLDGEAVALVDGAVTRVVLPGGHQVVATKPGYATRTISAVLSPGESAEIEIALEALPPPMTTERRWSRWTPWAVTGAGAAVLLAGLPVMASADASYDVYDDAVTSACAPPGGCARAELPDETLDLRQSGDRKKRSAQVLWAVGGAGVATGLVMLLLNQPRAVPAVGEVSVSADIGPAGASAIATWRF